MKAISDSLTRLKLSTRPDRSLSSDELTTQKVIYLDALKAFSPSAVAAGVDACVSESEWFPALKRLLDHVRAYDAAERATTAMALPAPGSRASRRESFLDRCGRLGFAVATMRELGDDNWRSLFEAHMRDELADDDLVAGLRRLQRGEPLRPRHNSRPPAQLVDLTKRLRDGSR